MGLREKLASRPIDNSGSRSSNRFDYQKDWALCHLLELHAKGHDYVFIFENHDDVTVIDSATDPKLIDLFQLKTSADGPWRLRELLKRKKLKASHAPSILGKLYDNRKHFGADTRSLNLVSNARYSMTLKTGAGCDNDDSVCIKDLCDDHVKAINDQLRTEHGMADDQEFAPIAYLIVTNLSLDDHGTHAKGKLSSFIEMHHPTCRCPLGPLYKTLYDEIKRKTNYERDGLDFQGLLEKKAISKQLFDKIMSDLPETKNFETLWQTIDGELSREAVPLHDKLALWQAFKKHELQRFDHSNTVLQKLRDAARKEVASMIQAGAPATLTGMLAQGEVALNALRLPGASAYDSVYLKAIILMDIYDY